MNGRERLKRQQEFLIKVAYWAVWGSIGILLIKFVGPALLPFIFAFFIAWLLYTPIKYLSERMHMNRNLAAIIAVAVFYAFVALLLYLLGSRIVELIQGVFSDITRFFSETIFPMVQNFCGWINTITGGGADGRIAAQEMDITGNHSAGIVSQADQMISSVSEKMINGVSGIAAYIPELCMNVLLMVIATLFMALDFPGILKFIQRLIPRKWQRAAEHVRDDVMGTLGKCILSYVIIFGMTFAELAVGFLLLGIDGAFTIALIIAFLDILPVLGTGTVLLPWMVIAVASGNLRMGIGLLVLYLIITIVRNIVEPRLVGGQIGLPPVVMLPCMIVGLRLFGFIGLFGLPFGVAFLKGLYDKGVIHFYTDDSQEWTDE